MGLDGLPRQLHVEQSLSCIDFEDFEPNPLADDPSLAEQTLVNCDEFQIRRIRLPNSGRISFPREQEPCLIHLISGKVRSGEETILQGETALVPYASHVELEACEATVLLVTDRFLR